MPNSVSLILYECYCSLFSPFTLKNMLGGKCPYKLKEQGWNSVHTHLKQKGFGYSLLEGVSASCLRRGEHPP